MFYLIFTVVFVAYVASVVAFGYPALIIGLLIAVALMFAWILGMTADGLRPSKGSGH